MSLPLAKLAAVIGTAAAGVAGVSAANSNSVSAGMQAGPACILQTAQPGGSYSFPVTVVNSGDGEENLRMTVGREPGGPAQGPPGRPVPSSWVSFGGPSNPVPAQQQVSVPVTITIPGGAPHGRYGGLITVTAYGHPGLFGQVKGAVVGLGAASSTWLAFSVDAPGPPRAWCSGQRSTWAPWDPPLPVCKKNQVPLQGRNPVCRVLPLAPPGVSAKNCHMSTAAWDEYMGQLRRAARRYAHNPSAYLPDAHCVVDGHLLNRRSYYRDTGQFRFAGGPRFARGQIQDARSVYSG